MYIYIYRRYTPDPSVDPPPLGYIYIYTHISNINIYMIYTTFWMNSRWMYPQLSMFLLCFQHLIQNKKLMWRIEHAKHLAGFQTVYLQMFLCSLKSAVKKRDSNIKQRSLHLFIGHQPKQCTTLRELTQITITLCIVWSPKNASHFMTCQKDGWGGKLNSIWC